MTHQQLIRSMICIFILALCSSAFAQQPGPSGPASGASTPATVVPEISPAKRTLIMKIIEITDAKAIGASFMDSMVQQMGPMLSGTYTKVIDENTALSPEEKAALNKSSDEMYKRLLDKAVVFLRQQLNFDELIESSSLQLYDKYFTEVELQDLVTFFQSSTGRKMIQTQPQILQESMAITSARVQAIMPAFDAYIESLVREETETLIKSLPQSTRTPTRRARH